MASMSPRKRFLIWGGRGWIAGHLEAILQSQGEEVHTTCIRLENREQVIQELLEVKPTHTLNAAGCTGRPNVDWCEHHREETLRSNVLGALNLADCCQGLNVHCTVFTTGCLYQYDAQHPVYGPGFTEEDKPNFFDSFYSETKGYLNAMLQNYPNCLILRLRMPVGDDLHPRSFVTKILGYQKVINVPNSQTILHDMLPVAIELVKQNDTGTFNLTNPGSISHNEVLDLFRVMVRPGLTYCNFTESEQRTVLEAGRSNCELDTAKLETRMAELGVEIPDIHQAYRTCFERMKAAGIQ